jgi:hypothetical protein
MRRAITLATLIAAAILAGTFHHARLRAASAIPDFDDESATEALVAKAHDITNLTAVGSAPFQFRATLFFNDPSGDAKIPPARGSYEFTWEAPDKWREDVELLHLKQVEIANGGALWTKRNAPYPSHAYWWARRAIEITRGVTYHFDSYTRIEISQIGGRNVVCARNGRAHLQQELCLDSVSALPILQFDAALNLQYVFGAWTQWGNHLYPRSIRAYSDTELVMRAEIANVSGAPPAANWITPPAEAASRDWCPDMRAGILSVAIENAARPDPNAPPGSTPIIGAIVYGVIGKDGSWLDLSVLESPDFKAAYAMLEKLQPFRNQPATCRGTPVESESVFRISAPR